MRPYYQHAGITIYHADCRQVLPILERVDLLLTDPPYNVGLGSKAHAARQQGYLSAHDAISEADYAAFIEHIDSVTEYLARVRIITPGNSNQHLWRNPKWTMCWTKSNGVTRSPLTVGQKMNHACWEPILIYGKLDNPPHSDVIDLPISMQPECEDHPCPKPLRLFQRLIGLMNGTVLDPFCGSGTTLVAAKNLDRKAIGIEIEEKYCEIAAKRLSQEVLCFD